MKTNVGQRERIIRTILGVVIMGAGYYYQSWWGLIGLVPLGTGLVGYCALYTVLGLNSCPTTTETKETKQKAA
jgi:hypothetical protein